RIDDLVSAFRLNTDTRFGELVEAISPDGADHSECQQEVPENHNPQRRRGPMVPAVQTCHWEDPKKRQQPEGQTHRVHYLRSRMDPDPGNEDFRVFDPEVK